MFKRIADIFLPRRRQPGQPAFDPELFVYVKLPEPLGPLDRAEKYEHALTRRLADENLGAVSGGGSSLGERRPDGTRPIAFCGIDVDVSDLSRALVVLREILPRLGAPGGTELHYTRGGERLQDMLSSDGWVVGQPRAFRHPGFGV